MSIIKARVYIDQLILRAATLNPLTVTLTVEWMREEDGFRVTVKRTICTVKESELDIILVSLAYTSKSVVMTIYINHCIIIMVGGVGKVCSKVQVYTPSS